MIVQTFVTLFVIELITVVGIFISFYLKQKIPASEFNLIIYCLLFELFGYFAYSVTYYYSTPTHIDDLSSDFTGLGYFLTISAIMLVTYVIILIDFRGQRIQLLEIIYFTWIGGVTAVYNGITFQAGIANGSIDLNFTPLGMLFIVAFYSFVIFIWIKRFLQISKIFRLQGSSKGISNELFIFLVIGILLILIYIISVLFFHLHGDYSFIAGGILNILGIGLFLKNKAFLFITDINLDSVIIIEKQSGMRLCSKIFINEVVDEDDEPDFIGSIISAINTAFSNTIRSHKDLQEMTFSNKTVIIFSGEMVRSILIVSASNEIAKGISKYLVKNFEYKYGSFIKEKTLKGNFFLKKGDYAGFEKEIMYIREFLPL